jgi:hypothetical protein
MARIGQPPTPPPSVWPWSQVRTSREKLVEPSEFERKRRLKKGDPRNPPLASAELLEFMGPGSSSDDLRLPPPPGSAGSTAGDVPVFPDRTLTRQATDRVDERSRLGMEKALAKANLPADRLDRLKSLLRTEAQMITLLQRIQKESDAVIERMKSELKANGQF